MAGEDLYTALQNLNVPATNTGYGIGAVALSQSLPKLVNPTGSVGRNLGVVLGGALMSSLLGYQARKQATEQSLLASTLGSQMLRMKTPEERLALIKGVDDSAIQPRLLDLQSALQGREEANRLGALEAGQRQEALYGALGSPAGQTYIKAQADLYGQKQEANLENKMALEAFRKESAIDLAKLKGTQRLQLESAIQEGKLSRDQAKAVLQDTLNQAQSRRRMAEDQFKSALDTETSSLPKDVREEVQDATSVSSRIFDLASRVEQMNVAEFKLYKNWDALPNSFKGEFADIAGTIGNVRYGASFTGNERKMLFDIFGDDLTTGPESFARNLRNAATALLQKAKTGVQVSQMKPVTINSMLDKMIANKSGFADMDIAAAPKAVMPEPVAADIDGVFNQLSGTPASNIAMQPKGSDLETRKQALVNKVNAAGGKVTDEDRKEAQAIAALEGR